MSVKDIDPISRVEVLLDPWRFLLELLLTKSQLYQGLRKDPNIACPLSTCQRAITTLSRIT